MSHASGSLAFEHALGFGTRAQENSNGIKWVLGRGWRHGLKETFTQTIQGLQELPNYYEVGNGLCFELANC